MIRIRLKEIAEERGLTQHEIVKITGLAPNTIKAYYHSQVIRPDMAVLNTLCEKLGVKLSELIVREGDDTADSSRPTTP